MKVKVHTEQWTYLQTLSEAAAKPQSIKVGRCKVSSQQKKIRTQTVRPCICNMQDGSSAGGAAH